MNRARQILDQVFEARPRKKKAVPAPVVPPEAVPDSAMMSPQEMETFTLSALGNSDLILLLMLCDRYGISISGSVAHRGRYYYGSSSVFEWTVDSYGLDVTPDDERVLDEVVPRLEEEIQEEVGDIGDKIYWMLEREYNYVNSDEAVDESIHANDYRFDEDGDEGGDIPFDDLDERAKERARNWYREGNSEDNFWSEHVIDEWKEELEKIGFEEPEIYWSGFSSQGDGACFKCGRFDFQKYANFFITGKDRERGRPYTDKAYEPVYRAEREAADRARALAAAVAQPPVAESEGDEDYEQFASDVLYSGFEAFARPCPSKNGFKHNGYRVDVHSAYRGSAYASLTIKDAATSDGVGVGGVEAELKVVSAHVHSGMVKSRKVTFFIPPGHKPELVKALMAYWVGVKERIRAIDDSMDVSALVKLSSSLAYQLSRLAGQWKRQHNAAYWSYLRAKAEKFAAANPEFMAKRDAQTAARVAKMRSEPSDEKLAMRAAMKKWKADRAAAAAAVPPPQQEV